MICKRLVYSHGRSIQHTWEEISTFKSRVDQHQHFINFKQDPMLPSKALPHVYRAHVYKGVIVLHYIVLTILLGKHYEMLHCVNVTCDIHLVSMPSSNAVKDFLENNRLR